MLKIQAVTMISTKMKTRLITRHPVCAFFATAVASDCRMLSGKPRVFRCAINGWRSSAFHTKTLKYL